MRQTAALLALNRGLVSRLGLARTDLKRLALAAETMTNWMPRVLGSMSVRPGLGYTGATLSNAASRSLPFIFATDDTARMEFTASNLRIWIGDTLLTRPAVTSAVTNASFTSDLTGWTDNDERGGVSTWVSPGYMQLVGDGAGRAIRDQQVTTVETGTEHALRVVIARGPVSVRVGSTQGDDDYVSETVLLTGTHSLSFTPTGNFWIRFFSSQIPVVWVDSCTIESAGVVTLPTPYGASDLDHIRIDQSGDIVFAACAGFQQRRIERRGTRPNARSWSVVTYVAPDGPFMIQNTSSVTLTPSALTGNITVTASKAMFKSTHVGGLFSITSVGQDVTKTTAVSTTATDSIRVTGVANDRDFSVIISGNASSSTVDLQRSYDNLTWANVGAPYSYTANVTATVSDALNNQIVYYRLILTTRVAPDTVTMELRIGSGSVRGIVRVTGHTSATQVSAEVLKALGGTSANTVWQEGQWSDVKGWPTSVALDGGRLWWAGKNGVWASVSDAYDSFDETVVGDSGPINRTIGAGPVDTINWLLPLKRLILGAQGSEITVKSSSLEEPITPTNFSLPTTSTQGSGAIAAVKIDTTGCFINRSGVKLYELSFELQSYDYIAKDLMAIVPELGVPGIVRVAVQRQPDTRIHCVRSDGVALILVFDNAEEVNAWVTVETDGFIEDVLVLPAVSGSIDDQVYYTVRRTINGATVRYHEKWAQEVDCRGGATSRLADSHLYYAGPLIVVPVAHLEGEEVVVWGNSTDLGTDDSALTWTQTYTVSGGQITLANEATGITVGLGYTADFKSAKLGSATQDMPTSLNRSKFADHIGLLMADVHPRGLRFGPSFDVLNDLPGIEAGAVVGAETQTAFDQEIIEFPGEWTTDARICLRAVAPRACTVLAVQLDMG